jgi:hypothetical protein
MRVEVSFWLQNSTQHVSEKRGRIISLMEIKGPPNPKESETIDISPVSPDCKGGHEFIVKLNCFQNTRPPR